MIKLINVNKYYKSGSENYHALIDVNLEFDETGMTFILGKSGSGKSTLLNIIGGIDSYDQGDLLIDNISTKNFSNRDYHIYRNSYVGFVFQEFNVLKGLSVWDNIALSLELQHINTKHAKAEIQEIIDKVGLTGLEKRMMNQISGGQRQRVAIARALIKKPKMIIADEPTGNLDSNNSKMIMNLLKELSVDHLIIIVTHNDQLAHNYADRIIGIKDGKTFESLANPHPLPPANQPQLKPVKVPYKTSLTLAIKSFIKNKYRFLMMILLFTLSLMFAGVVVNLSVVDTSKIYADYQEEYGNFVLNINKRYSSHGITASSAFFSHEITDLNNLYTKNANYLASLKGMDYYIPINPQQKPVDPFYIDYIQRIHVYDHDVLSEYQLLYGSLRPLADYTTLITDYLAQTLIHYQYFGTEITSIKDLINQEISYQYFTYPLKITGIIKTNYQDFQPYFENNSDDTKVTTAFLDNLLFYSSLFVNSNPEGASTYELLYHQNNMSTFYDDVIFNALDSVGTGENVRYAYYSEVSNLPSEFHATKGKAPLMPKEGEHTQVAVSIGFFKEILKIELVPDDYFDENNQPISELDAYFNKICYTKAILQANGNYLDTQIYSMVYVNGVSRVPASLSVNIVDIINDPNPVIYTPNDNTDKGLMALLLRASFGSGGFVTILNQAAISPSHATLTSAIENADIFNQMMQKELVITNQTYRKILLVNDFIDSNLLLFLAIFFVFGLFSVLLIFNFVIINIKNSTRDIGIYMSLGMSGWRIALIYLFQVFLMGIFAFILACIAMTTFLLIIDSRFTMLAAVNLPIIKVTLLGIGSVLAISILVPSIAVAIPLLDLSRKHPIDVIKSA